METNDPGSFPTTRWTLILALKEGSPLQRERALEDLCKLYWYPVYGFVRYKSHSPQEAQDLTQSFFAQLLQNDALVRADASKGKLRSYLLGAAGRFLINDWRKRSTQKRGGEAVTLSIDHELAETRLATELTDGISPEQAFDRRWAQTVLERVDHLLEGEYAARDRLPQYRALHRYLTWNAGEPAYADVAGELGMTEGAVRQAVVRMRKRYGALLREQVSFTVDEEDKVDEEIRHLFVAFGSAAQS